jgi:hypothetical protein
MALLQPSHETKQIDRATSLSPSLTVVLFIAVLVSAFYGEFVRRPVGRQKAELPAATLTASHNTELHSGDSMTGC